jgi:hypothetical protein
MVHVANRRDVAEAAAVLRRLLDLVARGELDVSAGQGTAMLRRIEGAAVALEESSR